MTDISSGFLDPGDNKNADRDDLPMTQVNDDEVEAHRRGAAEGGGDASTEGDPGATEKPDGLGSDGTIPNEPGGVGVGAGAPSTFEPEEDVEAARRRDDRSTP